MKQAYLDCSSGISGDMFLAALIDAGAPVDRLFGELKKLPLGFYEFKRTRALRGGLVGTRVDIRVPGEHRPEAIFHHHRHFEIRPRLFQQAERRCGEHAIAQRPQTDDRHPCAGRQAV